MRSHREIERGNQESSLDERGENKDDDSVDQIKPGWERFAAAGGTAIQAGEDKRQGNPGNECESNAEERLSNVPWHFIELLLNQMLPPFFAFYYTITSGFLSVVSLI